MEAALLTLRWCPVTPCTVIAIDGPAGSGKSSTSRALASRLGLRYLDTGAMYRAMAWGMLQRGVDLADPFAIGERSGEPEVHVSTSPVGQVVSCDGVDVTDAIRGEAVTAAVSSVSAVPQVRARLVELQREAVSSAVADGAGIVVEGRDIGTVVLPDAKLKVFLTADEAERARRRALEEAQRAGAPDAEQAADDAAAAVREQLAARDAVDSGRAASPLRPADDAVVVDATSLSLDEVVDRMVQLATERGSDE